MDAWTDEQLNKMKLGGNKRLNEFLSKYEVDKLTPIIEKYHSRAAEVRDAAIHSRAPAPGSNA
jgi:hypothetical protein